MQRGPLVKPAVIKVAAKTVAAENAPQAIRHTTIGTSHTTAGTSQTTIAAKHMIKRRLGDAEAMFVANNNVSGNRPLGDAPEAGSRKGITGYKPHCGGVT